MTETDDRIARLSEDEIPGPGNMCFHWLKSRHVCTLIPNHEGEHRYSEFTVKEEEK